MGLLPYKLKIVVTNPWDRYTKMAQRGEVSNYLSEVGFRCQDDKEEMLFHISETGELADASTNNDGTLADLHQTIQKLIKDYQLLKNH